MSCPKGKKPSAEYVTCESEIEDEITYHGEWKYPPGVERHAIYCVDIKCEDLTLNENYYDETVDVSLP